MQVIKFRDETISGEDESTLKWTEVTNKEELMVEVFTSEKMFEDLSMYWNDLAKRADCKVYMSFEWAYNWWQHFGKNKQRSLFIITIWDGTKLVGVAPCYKGYSKFGSLKLETRLQIIGSGGSPNEQLGYLDDYGISDFLDFVVDRDYRSVIAKYLVEDMLTPEFLGVDVIKLHQAGDDSFIMNYLLPRLEEQTDDITVQHSDTCPYVDLSQQESLKGYIKEQKSNARRRIRQTLRAEGAENEYVIEDVSENWEEVEKATGAIIDLHQSRWNRLGFPGVFYDQRFTDFFKDTLKYAFDNNWLWYKQAQDSEGVCALRMVLKFNGRYYDYISGFDELRPSSKYRPGIGLLVDLVQDGINDSIHRIELLRGEEEYKYDFTSETFKNWTVTIPIRKRKMNIPLKLNRAAALFYKYFTRESKLMNVQRQEKGILKMIPGYISFRWMSVKLKLKS